MAWLGDVEGVRFYIDQGVKVNAWSASQFSALAESCAHGHGDFVRLLLDHGAGMEIVTNDHHSPLSIAIHFKRVEVVSELVARGADKEFKNSSGHNAISEAGYQGY